MSQLGCEYAKALYEIAREDKKEKDIYQDLREFVSSIDEDSYHFFMHPGVKDDVKKEIINKTIKNDKLMINFLYVLIDKKRFMLLDDILDEYKEILDNERNVVPVTVYSNKKLSNKYLGELKQKLERQNGFIANIENVIDEKIIAGVKIKYRSKVIDETVNTYLAGLVDYLKM